MAVYFVTGKLGSGKSLAAVGRIRDALLAGKIVATNLNIFLEKFPRRRARDVKLMRLPDKPTAQDMHDIGKGNESYDESKNGLVVLDECGTWFNSRTWNDKDRAALIDWFLHARKLGWDIIFIIQDISVVDKQARECLCEHVVFCKRLDRLLVPFIGGFLKIFGVRLTLPKAHLGIVKYGDSQNSLTVDRWWYRGSDLYDFYDTKQAFTSSGPGLSSMLTPWHLVGRYLPLRKSVLEQVLLFSLKLIVFLVWCFRLGNLPRLAPQGQGVAGTHPSLPAKPRA